VCAGGRGEEKSREVRGGPDGKKKGTYSDNDTRTRGVGPGRREKKKKKGGGVPFRQW